MKKSSGRLDTPIPIFKSHKTMCSEQRSSQLFLRISFLFCFLYLAQHMTGRTVLRKTNNMPADIYQALTRFGRLDTPALIFKSHKTMCSQLRSSQLFLHISFLFCFLFLPQHMTGRTVLIICTDSQGYASDARRCDVSYSTQDCKPSASKRSQLFSHSNRPYLSHIWNIISFVGRRRYPASVIQF